MKPWSCLIQLHVLKNPHTTLKGKNKKIKKDKQEIRNQEDRILT